MSQVREANYDEVYHAQSHFRRVLDSMARPGKINELEALEISTPSSLSRAASYVALAMLNGDVGYWDVAGSAELRDYLRVNVGCLHSKLEEADYVFVDGSGSASVVALAKEGLLTYPDLGATLVIDVSQVVGYPVDGYVGVEISGPGVLGSKRIWIGGLDRTWIHELSVKNAEFPLGVDVIFAFEDEDGESKVCCLPRSSRLTLI